MKVLLLEPFLGGSHKAFVEGWQEHSRHSFTILGYPAHKWKWRMRHSSHTLADDVNLLSVEENEWDVLFCSDMLNLPEFLGFAPPGLREIPAVAYFHENQLTYPMRNEYERDIHFGYTNYLTAMAATEVWFNSDFHRRSFLAATRDLLRRMPDNADLSSIDAIDTRSKIMPQGIGAIPDRAARPHGPPHIAWAARWEHDKNPELFFEALNRLVAHGVDFRLSVLGQHFDTAPEVFAEAQKRLERHIVAWGYQRNRDDYLRVLRSADIFISTANHEFFGVSTVEAIAAGCYPLLPHRLAYPEVIGLNEHPEAATFFYDGSVEHLVVKLADLLEKTRQAALWTDSKKTYLAGRIDRYRWEQLAPIYDLEIDRLVSRDN